MSDLDININLARAMGWVKLTHDEWFYSDHVGYRIYENKVQCSYGHLHGFSPFDYRDPVIFDAIIAHWELDISWLNDFFTNEALVDVSMLHGNIFTRPKNKRYEAAALCVIDAVKRGVK